VLRGGDLRLTRQLRVSILAAPNCFIHVGLV
jgi:hypothetical protein